MPEHLSNGQFASKEQQADKETPNKGRFVKGGKGGPGRPMGSQNRTTRAVKEFLAELVDDPEVQEAVRGRIVKGDAVAFFRGLEHVVGKPAFHMTVDGSVTLQLEERIRKARERVE